MTAPVLVNTSVVTEKQRERKKLSAANVKFVVAADGGAEALDAHLRMFAQRDLAH